LPTAACCGRTLRAAAISALYATCCWLLALPPQSPVPSPQSPVPSPRSRFPINHPYVQFATPSCNSGKIGARSNGWSVFLTTGRRARARRLA